MNLAIVKNLRDAFAPQFAAIHARFDELEANLKAEFRTVAQELARALLRAFVGLSSLVLAGLAVIILLMI